MAMNFGFMPKQVQFSSWPGAVQQAVWWSGIGLFIVGFLGAFFTLEITEVLKKTTSLRLVKFIAGKDYEEVS